MRLDPVAGLEQARMMTARTRNTFSLMGILAMAHGMLAQTVVHFDDLAADTVLTGGTYGGLTWEAGIAGYGGNIGDWRVPPTGNFPASGTRNVVNGWGSTSIGVGFPGVVNVLGASISPQSVPAVTTTGVRVVGYAAGTQVGVTDWFAPVANQATWMPIALGGVDRIVFESQAVYGGAGWFGMDDLTYTVVPEPEVHAMAWGLALAAGAAWRRWRR